ncbi:DoxX-like family protein [Glycomyces sambucus]|uniref:DoxX-like family protein n=1 Tax=Glycomyces sambucus TaxID=380244 RepID=A0A1G9H4X4_9ACTN|nr:DoxX family protein [Glycomyces sambucus]SDL08068.1 DoxX-like family protein [Glycomyces sambucus]
MPLFAAILAALAALVLLMAGAQKIALRRNVTEPMRRLGVADRATRLIGVLELAGASGLVVGIWFVPLGLAAGIGLAALLLSAVVVHARAGDSRSRHHRGSAAAPIVLLLVLGLAGTLLVI